MTMPMALTNQWNDFLIREFDPYAMAKYEILLEWMGDIKGKSVLVIGCGSGEFCAMLAQGGAKVMATDIDSANIELAKKVAEKFNVNFETQVTKVETISTNTKYDYVVATDVLEHIENDKGAVAKLRQLSKIDGQLVISVPALGFLMGYHDEALGHFRRYNASNLRQLISKDFQITKMRYFGFTLIPVSLLISRILRRPMPAASAGRAQAKRGVSGRMIEGLFKFERHFHFGLGTSLLLIGRPKN